MKNLPYIGISGPVLFQGVYAQNEKQETVEGNGKLVTKEVPVASSPVCRLVVYSN